MDYWPSYIPKPSSLSESVDDPYIEATSETGDDSARVRYSKERQGPTKLTWKIMRLGDFVALKQFYADHRAIEFLWLHPSRGLTYKTRFVSSPISSSEDGKSPFVAQVEVTLQIVELAPTEQEQPSASDLMDTINAGADKAVQAAIDAEQARDDAKEYAKKAAASAKEAADTAAEIPAAVEAGIEQIGAAGTSQVSAVNAAGSTQTSKVNSAGTTQVAAVEDAGSEQIAAVKAEGQAQTATAKAQADAAAASAEEAAERLAEFKNLGATAETLAAGSNATASFDSSTGVITIGVPSGKKGDKGDKGDPGTFSEDGVTVVANASGEAMAKDVAIGGNASDLASARGQIGTPPIQIFTKTSADDAATLNLNDDKWWVNGEYSLYLRSEVFSFTPVVNNTPLEVSGNYSARLRVANVYHTGNGIQEFSIAIGGRTIRTYYRTRFFNSDNTFSYYPWREAILTSNLGDGIRVTNGIISVPEYKGATASTSGTSGLVPPATAGQQESFLTGGGEYKPALTKISDSVTSEDSTTAASAKAVKTAYDLASAALPKSGGTISGNISVVGGITVAAPDGESEGGQILLKNGTDGSYPVVIDTTNNQIRFFGGPGDIVHVDLETGKFVGNLTGKADSADSADNALALAGRTWLESLYTDSPGWVIGSVDEQLRPINTGSLKVLAADRIISGSFAYGRASDGFYLPNGGSWFVFCILDNDVSHGSTNAIPIMAAGGSRITWSFNGTGYTWIGIKVL